MDRPRRRTAPRRPPGRPHRDGLPPARPRGHAHRLHAQCPAAHGAGTDTGRPGLPTGLHVDVGLRPPAALSAPERGRLPGHGRVRGRTAGPPLPRYRRGRRAQPRLQLAPAPRGRDRPPGPIRELHRRPVPQPGALLEHRDVAGARRLRSGDRRGPRGLRQHGAVPGPPAPRPAERGGGLHRHHPGRGAHRRGSDRTPRAAVRRLRQRRPPRLGPRRGRTARGAQREITLRHVAHGSVREGTPRRASTSATPTSTRRTARPPAPCGRAVRSSARRANRTSCAGSPRATPVPPRDAATATESTR